MRESGWLKQALNSAKVTKDARPAWAKVPSVQTELNSHPQSNLPSNESKSLPMAEKKNSQGGLGL
jgi:hypothetical protein